MYRNGWDTTVFRCWKNEAKENEVLYNVHYCNAVDPDLDPQILSYRSGSDLASLLFKKVLEKLNIFFIFNNLPPIWQHTLFVFILHKDV